MHINTLLSRGRKAFINPGVINPNSIGTPPRTDSLNLVLNILSDASSAIIVVTNIATTMKMSTNMIEYFYNS